MSFAGVFNHWMEYFMRNGFFPFTMVLAGLLLLPIGAQAESGQMSFSGSIIGSTCTINGGNNDVSVELPAVQSARLVNPGQTDGRRSFQLTLTDCTAGLSRVQTYFDRDSPAVNPQTGRLVLDEGGATNVEIQLLNSLNAPINAAGESGNQNSQVVNIVNGRANLIYAAQYYSLGGATPGVTTTRIQYALTYP
ncbi:type 1 fimbrial protein [Pseudomonas sp. LS1212]|uniref:fimbrial protein n=1 Tax=Pseudomonas sp. LS1212 TaxID=2972478 RepID=UPI00215D1AAD|nr:fimbrial protein [Pseudomonas sp. LS1212]UVJ46074.1 type 1 fimbrial protein [Pseudomonas sp. LS1212]